MRDNLTTLDDEQLVQLAQSGQLEALNQLVKRYQSFIYNVALRYVLSPQDAEDLSQEVLVKIVTRISQFAGDSSFRTWAYRITVNTFLDTKKAPLEGQIQSFSQYGAALDALPLQELSPAQASSADLGLLVEEAKLGCMLGMLLCLNREQRLTFIVGDLFDISSELGGEIFAVSPATFRKRLQRARRDLRNFMDNKCGLINQSNPCRCKGKTMAFIDAGWVDPKALKFTRPALKSLTEKAKKSVNTVDALLEDDYVELYRQHPYYEGPDWAERFNRLLNDERVKEVFRL